MSGPPIEALKAAHDGEVYTHTIKGEVVAVTRTPTLDEVERFLDERNDSAKKGKAIPKLFMCCCVWPVGPDLAALVKRQPFLPATLGNKVAEAAGATDAAEVEKA